MQADQGPLSLQLWSTRGDDPLPEQLRILAEMGYTDVQPFHDQYADVPYLRDCIVEAGMTCASGHFHFGMFEGDAGAVISAARALGMKLVVAPWLDEDMRPTDKDGWKAMHDRLAGFRERVEDAGLRFAWHNHDFEFAPLPDGSRGIEYLLGDDIGFAADLAWIHVAGEDPAAWLRRYEGRIPAIHVKDVAAAGTAPEHMGFADIGTGVINWTALWHLLDQLEIPLRIAEHDQPVDWRRFARVSAAALKRLRAGQPIGQF
jgi:sugar phosphate isomerase/epimerase